MLTPRRHGAINMGGGTESIWPRSHGGTERSALEKSNRRATEHAETTPLHRRACNPAQSRRRSGSLRGPARQAQPVAESGRARVEQESTGLARGRFPRPAGALRRAANLRRFVSLCLGGLFHL